MSGSDELHTAASRVAIALLVIHAFLLGWVAYVSSPNLDEQGHLASGISHQEYGRWDNNGPVHVSVPGIARFNYGVLYRVKITYRKINDNTSNGIGSKTPFTRFSVAAIKT